MEWPADEDAAGPALDAALAAEDEPAAVWAALLWAAGVLDAIVPAGVLATGVEAASLAA